jgi:hypothetical protein
LETAHSQGDAANDSNRRPNNEKAFPPCAVTGANCGNPISDIGSLSPVNRGPIPDTGNPWPLNATAIPH